MVWIGSHVVGRGGLQRSTMASGDGEGGVRAASGDVKDVDSM
jgi:hypothetical protein